MRDSSVVISTAFRASGNVKIAREKQKIKLDSQSPVICIESGAWALYFNNKIIYHPEKGDIPGIFNLFSPSPLNNLYCAPIIDAVYYEMPVEKFTGMFNNQTFLHAVLSSMSDLSLSAGTIMSRIIYADAYHQIKFTLEWIERADRSFREENTLIHILEERTTLSKSHISAILKELKAGGHILLDKGHLYQVNHPLPEQF